MFTVGFGSALLGAVAGFAGALYLTRRSEERRRRGIVRAFLSELLDNSTKVIIVAAGKERFDKFSTSVWDEAKIEIAEFAASATFAGLMGVYSGVQMAELAVDGLARGDVSYRPALATWYGALQDAFNTLRKEHGLDHANTKWLELEPFDEALQELSARLARAGIAIS